MRNSSIWPLLAGAPMTSPDGGGGNETEDGDKPDDRGRGENGRGGGTDPNHGSDR